MKSVYPLVVLAGLLLSSCKPVAGCGGEAFLTLFTTARDSVSGGLLANAVLKAVDENGNIAGMLTIAADTSEYPVGLSGHAGTFTVSVQATGYKNWERTVVVGGGCTPADVSVTARM